MVRTFQPQHKTYCFMHHQVEFLLIPKSYTSSHKHSLSKRFCKMVVNEPKSKLHDLNLQYVQKLLCMNSTFKFSPQ